MEMLWNYPLLLADGRRMQQTGSEQRIAEQETYLGNQVYTAGRNSLEILAM
jgi:hypothetical protein